MKPLFISLNGVLSTNVWLGNLSSVYLYPAQLFQCYHLSKQSGEWPIGIRWEVPTTSRPAATPYTALTVGVLHAAGLTLMLICWVVNFAHDSVLLPPPTLTVLSISLCTSPSSPYQNGDGIKKTYEIDHICSWNWANNL